MTSPTLFDEIPTRLGQVATSFCNFPVPLTPEAVEMLGPRFAHAPRPPLPTSRPSWVREHDDTLTARWWSFHLRHPDVYDGLVRLARQARQRGVERLGIGLIYEVLRWETMMGADVPSEEPFKLNNDYRSSYARWLMETCPDLDGLFMTRAAEADGLEGHR